MALTELPDGAIGTVVTYLEMMERPPLRPTPHAPFRMQRWQSVDPRKYRLLFKRVGARWLWYSRLAMSDDRLRSAIGDLHVVIDGHGIEVGMVELDFARPSECAIRFLGLVPELTGRGYGKWLLANALALTWRKDVRRVHVHTCTLDHPAALPAYLRAGFVPYKQAFESFPDPRLSGLLPRDCAPHIPLIESGG